MQRRKRDPRLAVLRPQTGCRTGRLVRLSAGSPLRPANYLVVAPGGRRQTSHRSTPQLFLGGSSKARIPPSAGWVQGCALPPKTRQQEGIPINKFWLRAASPSMRSFAQTTSSQMGWRSESPATPHAKRRWSSESAANLPEGALCEGEGKAAPTPCSTDAKAWTVASEIPSVANHVAGGASVG